MIAQKTILARLVKMTSPTKLTAIVLGTAAFFTLLVFMKFNLNFAFFISDVADYWHDSLNWRTPYHPYHVPGYPLLIALFNFMTMYILPPMSIMWIIALSSYLCSIFLIIECLRAYTGEQPAFLGSITFMLWPFVGVTAVVQPLADNLAIALLLASIYLYLKEHELYGSIVLGLALITHKATWLFAALLILFYVLHQGRFLALLSVLAVLTPLVLLLFAGSFYHGSVFWMFESTLGTEVSSRSNLPLLDGIVGEILYGGISGVIKGSIIAIILIVAVCMFFIAMRRPHSQWRWCGLAISAAIAIYCITLNQNSAFAAIRYGKLLVLPAFWLLGAINSHTIYRRWMWPLLVPVFVALYVTQMGFAYYMATIYHAN